MRRSSDPHHFVGYFPQEKGTHCYCHDSSKLQVTFSYCEALDIGPTYSMPVFTKMSLHRRAISHMLSTLFFPLLPLVLQLIVIGACGSTAMWLTASGRATGRVFNSTDDVDNQRNNDTCDPNAFSDLYPNATGHCRFEKFSQEPYMFFFQVYNAFGFLWATAFCSALGQMTLAGAFASYYWAWLKPDDLPWFPLLASLYRCFRYHLGSLALGSFLIATVQLALYSLLKLQRKLRRIENRCTRCLIK
ncbi:hypothetical protein RvY_12453-3 [Ramazzottius varieornatus]|uniref:Choline transporter-like protein n=1 Tax=Ramazzottius varieornatus TaxID=947166 RepID=A0A1D1VLI5_RAMVA|nr:hypothetical protein RvY_12453-3 [Ramazzottius varieornatus]